MEYKLGTTLNLDPVEDREIIEKIKYIKEKRLMSSYIKAMFKHSDEFLPEDKKIDINKDPITDEIIKLKKDVNGMMTIIEELNCLAKSGKVIGLSGMVEESSLAVYYLQKQIQKIESVLGLKTKYTLFENNKLKDLNELTMRVVDKIIDVFPQIMQPIRNDYPINNLNNNNNNNMEDIKQNEIIEEKKEETTDFDLQLFFQVAGDV